METGKISGNGYFTKKCQREFEEKFGFQKSLLTTSCTDALEMSALLTDLVPGDEIIMPSYTFPSTANAFLLRGCKIKFLDISKDDQQIDLSNLEAAITDKTKAVVPVHYGGSGCRMDTSP